MPFARRPAVAFATFLVVLCCGPSALAAKNIRKLTLRDLDGKKVHLSEYQGRVVVLNFWATWCGPCKEELPRLSEIAQHYADRNVGFVLVSIDEQKKLPAIRDYISQQKVSLPVWVGAGGGLYEVPT